MTISSDRPAIRILVLPLKAKIDTQKKKVPILAQYIIPHACCWTYSKLKSPLLNIALTHETGHALQRGSPLIEYLKIDCLDPSMAEVEKQNMITEMEGLAVMHALVATLDNSDIFEVLDEVLTNPFVKSFSALAQHIFERTANRDFWDILFDMLDLSGFVVNTRTDQLVAPSVVLARMLENLEVSNARTIDLQVYGRLVSKTFKDKQWIRIDPLFYRTIFSLKWAALLASHDNRVSAVALRNFLETAFLIPVNAWFLVDPDSFIAGPARIVDGVSSFLLKGKPAPDYPLRQFVYELTKRICLAARELVYAPLGEERFTVRILPEVASEYVQGLVEDSLAANPRFYPRHVWGAIANEPLCNVGSPGSGSQTIGAFMRSYEQQRFHKELRNAIEDGLYYPADCVDIVESQARKSYARLEELADDLFIREGKGRTSEPNRRREKIDSPSRSWRR